jgi:hypothetical protein
MDADATTAERSKGRPLVRSTVPLAALVTALLVASVATAADYYKLSGVKRVDQDLYKTSDGLYIETQYCYHYTYGEDAVVKWEFANSFNNKVIWADDSNCTVKKLWRK